MYKQIEDFNPNIVDESDLSSDEDNELEVRTSKPESLIVEKSTSNADEVSGDIEDLLQQEAINYDSFDQYTEALY